MSKTTDTIELHGDQWERGYIEENVAYYKSFNWQKQRWLPRDALVHRKGGQVSLYVGQRYDPERIDLVKNGWDHDHCVICWWPLSDTGDSERGEGYTDGNDWLCIECYTKLVAPAQAEDIRTSHNRANE